MRLNQFIARSTGMSRRAADKVIGWGRVTVNGEIASAGQQVDDTDEVAVDNSVITPTVKTLTIMLNKPVGYVCSRDGQGNKTIYELLPEELSSLKSIGRLDKHSSGLLLLTNDGKLAHELTHPSFQKTKVYKIALNKPLEPLHRQMISDNGITLDDGVSKLQLERINDTDNTNWKVVMSEGRNRQIRRTFEALAPHHTCANGSVQQPAASDNSSTPSLVPTGTTKQLSEPPDTAARRPSGHCPKCGEALGYNVVKLHRTHFGSYVLEDLKPGEYKQI